MADAETTAFAAAFYGGFVNDELHKRGMPSNFEVLPEHVLTIWARLKSDYFVTANDIGATDALTSLTPIKCCKCRNTIAPGSVVHTYSRDWTKFHCVACRAAAIEKHRQEMANGEVRAAEYRRTAAVRRAQRRADSKAASVEVVDPGQLDLFRGGR